jgi:hypothetical protein
MPSLTSLVRGSVSRLMSFSCSPCSVDLSVVLWALGACLIPLLLAAGVWRHLLRWVPRGFYDTPGGELRPRAVMRCRVHHPQQSAPPPGRVRGAPGRTTANSGFELCIPPDRLPGPAQHAGPGQLSRRCWSLAADHHSGPAAAQGRHACAEPLPGTSDARADCLHVVSRACRDARWVSSAGLRRLLRRGPALEYPRAERLPRPRRSRLARQHARRASGETASPVRLASAG